MYAYERSLVEKYQDKPVVLLGVNTDPDRNAARRAVARHSLPWRSWWAGSPDGDIPTRWRVTGFPSLFVIDAQGVLRYRNVQPGADLERAVEALLREMQ